MSFRPTRIQHLYVRGYRSLREVSLRNLPSLVVMHGPNGSGKSNVLRAFHLLLRAIALPDILPSSREEAISFDPRDAKELLGLDIHDFHQPGPREIRIEAEISIGKRALEAINEPKVSEGDMLLEVTFQEVGGSIKFWFDRATMPDGSTLFPENKAKAIQLVTQLNHIANQIEQHKASVEQLRNSYPEPLRKLNLRNLEQSIENLEVQRRHWIAQQSEHDRISERLRKNFLRDGLIQVSEAYRFVDDLEPELFRMLLSGDLSRRTAIRRLSALLQEAGLFGGQNAVELIPIQDEDETTVRIHREGIGELPLKNLGTGEQQILALLARRVITPCPIAQIEEPEVHLHANLMAPLADLLRRSISPEQGPPDLDQLWISTHHHALAISKEFLEVSLENGATRIEQKPRAEAIRHFYEPEPYWSALEDLVNDGLSEEEVLFTDENGQAIKVAEVRASIHGDRTLANRFVKDALRSVLLSLKPSS